jgi:hypothetical protein
LSFVTLAIALLKLANVTINWLQQRNLLDAGASALIGEQLSIGMGIVRHAQDIRNAVTSDNVGEQLDFLRPPSERKAPTDKR